MKVAIILEYIDNKVILKVLQIGDIGPYICSNWKQNEKSRWKQYRGNKTLKKNQINVIF